VEKPNSVIVYDSSATTSIYWSSQLDRSDQLQQSAATFSCKTGLVAVHLETHYNIASKRGCVSDQRTWEVTQLFTYLLTHKLFISCIRRYLVSRACWLLIALFCQLHLETTQLQAVNNVPVICILSLFEGACSVWQTCDSWTKWTTLVTCRDTVKTYVGLFILWQTLCNLRRALVTYLATMSV